MTEKRSYASELLGLANHAFMTWRPRQLPGISIDDLHQHTFEDGWTLSIIAGIVQLDVDKWTVQLNGAKFTAENSAGLMSAKVDRLSGHGDLQNPFGRLLLATFRPRIDALTWEPRSIDAKQRLIRQLRTSR